MGNVAENLRMYRRWVGPVGISRVELSRVAQVDEPVIASIERGDCECDQQTMERLAAALNVSEEALTSDRYLVPVVGCVGAGDRLVSFGFENRDPTMVVAPEGLSKRYKVVAVRIHGESMEPLFHNNQTVFYRCTSKVLLGCMGKVCVVQVLDEEGPAEMYIKTLAKGKEKGLYTLKSANNLVKDIVDVRLAWASEVIV